MQACQRCEILGDRLNPIGAHGLCRWCVEEKTYTPAQLANLRDNGQSVSVEMFLIEQ